MPRHTETVVSKAPQGGTGSDWALAVALECERIGATPLRLALARIDEVEIGGGEARRADRAGKRLRLELPDRWASRVHARMVRTDEGWTVEDQGSKNGTRRNGARIDGPTAVDAGDVLECGGTFLVLRRGDRAGKDLELPADRPDALRTLSPGYEEELSALPKLARSRVSVLLRGESGTGKEVMARAVHALSRRTGPLVAVNCGAIPANLVESELFGTRRGAFTGAGDRPGLVRSADRGTLFLDEVADLPLASQAALLRVLQEGEVLPIGADKPAPVDLRLVAATNQPLEALVDEGRFRRDLLARLRGYELRLPGLRQRIEDMGLLLASLLARLQPDRPAPHLARSAARALFAHPWPFHVRELEHCLRAALAVASPDAIRLEDLALSAGAEPAEAVAGRERLVELLREHAGNVSAVARELVTSRSQVQRLIERHGLTLGDYRRG